MIGRRTLQTTALFLMGLMGLLSWPVTAWAAGGEESISSLLYQALNLLILLAVLFYFARKPALEYFATRRADVKRDLETAGELLAEAETRNAEIQRKLADLQSETEEIQENSRRRADEECERLLAEARRQAERVQSDAEVAAEQEFARARRALRAEAANLAAEIADRLVKEKIGDSDQERLLDEFITRVDSSPAAKA